MDEKNKAVTKEHKDTMSNKKFGIILASPILAPIILCAVIMLFMFVGCGWLFVAMTFFATASAAAIGIIGIAGAYVNLAAGIGAVLIMLGIGLSGLGLSYPLFCISKEFFKGFSALSEEMLKKMKEIKSEVVSTYENL